MMYMYAEASTAVFLLGPLLLLLLLAGVGGIIALIASRKTRAVGILLVGLGGLVAMLLLVRVSYHASRINAGNSAVTVFEEHNTHRVTRLKYPSSISRRADTRTREQANAEYAKAMQEVVDEYNGVKSPKNGKATAAPASAANSHDKAVKKAAAEPSPTADSPTVKVFEAMGRALGETLTGAKKSPVAEKKAHVVTKAPPKPPPPPDPDKLRRQAHEAVATEPPHKPSKCLPEWANLPPRMAGDAMYLMSIVVGPWPTRQDCDAHLPEELQKALDQYAEKCLGSPPYPRVVLPTEYLRQRLINAEYEEDIQSPSVGAMKQLHVLLTFDNEMKDRVIEQHRRGVAMRRLWAVGIGVAAILWPLAIVFAYLKIDLATGGAYRGRLRFAALLAILVPAALIWAVIA
jgi:hypothetical protein